MEPLRNETRCGLLQAAGDELAQFFDEDHTARYGCADEPLTNADVGGVEETLQRRHNGDEHLNCSNRAE